MGIPIKQLVIVGIRVILILNRRLMEIQVGLIKGFLFKSKVILEEIEFIQLQMA